MTTLAIRRPTRTWAGLRSFVADGDLVGGFDPERPASSGSRRRAATASRPRRRWARPAPRWPRAGPARIDRRLRPRRSHAFAGPPSQGGRERIRLTRRVLRKPTDARLSRPPPSRPGRALRAHDRQLRRRAPRPPGDAGAARVRGGAPRPAGRRADLRAAPARLLRRRAGKPESAPARIATLRDKLVRARALRRRAGGRAALRRRASRRSRREAFIDDVLVDGLGARYVLVGDDFRFGARAPATTRCSTPPATRHGFDVARMMSYEVHGLRVSSSAVREALAAGDMARGRGAARPALQHQRPRHPRRTLGRELGEAAPAAATAFAR